MRTVTKATPHYNIIIVRHDNTISKSDNVTRTVGTNKTYKVVNSKAGEGMNASSFRIQQTPVESPNGARVLFTLPNSENYYTGCIEVFVDGLLQTKNVDYTETSSTTFTMTVAPDTDETIRVNYIRS